MKELYTEAALRKCSKPKALTKLEKIYQGLHESDKENYFDDFADLMSFFTPTPTSKKVKTPLEWVNLAVSKEATRYYLAASYSDGEYLVATDGARLHRVKTDLPKGYYDKMGNAIDLDGNFPEYTKLFFDTKGKLEVTLGINKAELEKSGKNWVCVFNIEGYEYGINKKYLEDALNGKESLHGHLDIKPTDNLTLKRFISKFPFQSEDKSIILMPVKLQTARSK